jgi:hypothetical protein
LTFLCLLRLPIYIYIPWLDIFVDCISVVPIPAMFEPWTYKLLM